MLRSRSLGELLVLVVLGACSSRPGGVAPVTGGPIPAMSRQLLIVRSPTWDDIHATLQRFERTEPRAAWMPVGQLIPVVLGRTGLAWGRGLHGASAPVAGPLKREGDGRSPAGVFALGAAFGYVPRDSLPWIRLPYVQATARLRCVDDPESEAYNTLVERPAAGPAPWKSAEEMRRRDDLYRLGVVVEHNSGAGRVAGGGSCIFLHVWKGPDDPTVGCTAMPIELMTELLRWIDPQRSPVLVQLPEEVYRSLRDSWGLP